MSQAKPFLRRGWVQLGLLIVFGWALVFIFAITTHPDPTAPPLTPPTDPGVAHIVAPEDGKLTVGTTQVDQIPGQCSDSGCRFTPAAPDTLPTVKLSPTKPLTISSGRSLTYAMGVSSGPTPVANMRIVNNKMIVSPGAFGTWAVTVSGNAGGMWQFNVVVPKT